MNYARQIIIIANEMDRLLKVLCACSSSEAGVIYRIIVAVMFRNQFLEKAVEFANINAMNLVGIFCKKLSDIELRTIILMLRMRNQKQHHLLNII